MDNPNVTNRLYIEMMIDKLECELTLTTKDYQAKTEVHRVQCTTLSTIIRSMREQLVADDKRKTGKQKPTEV